MEKILIPAVSNDLDVKKIGFQIYIEDTADSELVITGYYSQEFEQACYIAITNLRRMQIKIPNYIHIHFLNYDFLKVGISCSLAIFSLLYMKIKNINLKNKLLVTGEIDIEGNIYEVGVIDEKFIAFSNDNSIKYMVIPQDNKLNSTDNIKFNDKVIGFKFLEELCTFLEGDL